MAADVLRRHGLSVTAQRLAVLRAVSADPHSTADDIETAVRGGDRCRLAASGLRRPRDPHREGYPAAHPTRRVAGPIRGSGGRQPPPPHLSVVQPDGGRRLRGRVHPVPDGRRRLRLRDRRSRSHLLGPMPRVCRAIRRAKRPRDKEDTDVSESENPAIAAPKPKPASAEDEPGLVAEPARPLGAPPALAARPTRWTRASTTPRSSRSSTSRR